MVELASQFSSEHRRTSSKDAIDLRFLQTYIELIEDALNRAVLPDVDTDFLRRGLRSKYGFRAVDAFFQYRLREALRIATFMGTTIRNPVALYLYAQDSRVLQRLLPVDSPLDGAEVERIAQQLNGVSLRQPKSVPLPPAPLTNRSH